MKKNKATCNWHPASGWWLPNKTKEIVVPSVEKQPVGIALQA